MQLKGWCFQTRQADFQPHRTKETNTWWYFMKQFEKTFWFCGNGESLPSVDSQDERNRYPSNNAHIRQRVLGWVQGRNQRKQNEVPTCPVQQPQTQRGRKKAIQTFKDHFVAVLCGTDENFPLQRWCQILRQAEHQLNMLRKSRTNPAISVFEQMHGQHQYKAYSCAVLGCELEIHVMPAQWRTWEAHTKTGY